MNVEAGMAPPQGGDQGSAPPLRQDLAAAGTPSHGPRLALRFPAHITVATLAASALIVLAAALRLVMPAWLELDGIEVRAALEAAGKAAPGVQAPDSPLLVSLETLSFWLFGPGTVQARLVGALAGIALVWAAMATGTKVGRGTALASASLFALSPVWVFYGRHASAEGLAAATTMGLLAASLASPPVRRWAVPLALGLVVTSGPPVITFAIGVAVAVVVTRGGLNSVRAWFSESWPTPSDRTWFVVVFGVTTLLGATAFLYRPEGFAQVIGTPAAWLARFSGAGQGAGDTVLGLLAHAPVALAFGIAGIAAGVRRGVTAAGGLAVWTGIAFLVVMLSGDPILLAELLLPLTLAAAIAVALLFSSVSSEFRWSEDGAMAAILVCVAGFVWVQAVAFANDPPSETGRYFLVLGGMVMIALLVVLFVALWGRGVALRALGLAALVILPALAWANGSALNYQAAMALREPLRGTYVTPDISRLVQNIQSASWNRTRDPNALGVRVDPLLAPILAWPLRDHEITWAAATGEVTDEVVIRPHLSTDVEGFGPDPYVGGTYTSTGSWIRSFPAGASETDPQAGARGFARWYLQRRSPSAAPDADIAYQYVDVFLKAED